jgi:NAD(P)-dependent dehydrogenase (short-subunit alcohol dehydrogenase family)
MSGPVSSATDLVVKNSLDGLPNKAHVTPRRWGQSFNAPLQDWQGKRVWLVGASSGIGLACAQALQAAGAHVVISARELGALSDWAKQSESEGKQLELYRLDVTDGLQVNDVTRQVAASGNIDMLLYCAGHYRAQRATNFDLPDMLRHQEVNYNGMLRVLGEVLPVLLKQGFGHISLVSSVAGWRGLPNGLAYGPTKAAMTNLAETLYMDLQDRGIGVSLISPGFVATPLTAQNNFQMPALLSPEQAAQAMLKGWAQGEFDIHFPKRFTLWLKLMRHMPYRLYFALVRRFTGL